MSTTPPMSAAVMPTTTTMSATGTMAHMVAAVMPTTAGTRVATTLVRPTMVADLVSRFGLPTAVVLRTFANIGLLPL